jgi:hypothetical protein
MADPHGYSDTGDDNGHGRDRESTTIYPGTPRWVKVFGIVLILLVLLVVIMMFAGAGGHGPGRHMPSGGAGDYIPPSSAMEITHDSAVALVAIHR